MSIFSRDKSKKWLRVAEKRGVDTTGHLGVWSYAPEVARTVAVLFDDRVVISRGGGASVAMGYGADLNSVPLAEVVSVGSEIAGIVGWVKLWGKGFEYKFPLPRRELKDAYRAVDYQVKAAKS